MTAPSMPVLKSWFPALALAVGPVVAAASEPPLSIALAAPGRFPNVEITSVFEPPGESHVRSSIRLSEGVALIGTEETGDIFKTEDNGRTWRQVWDGSDHWGIQDVRNFMRAQDGHLYITTSEPALVVRSEDEGETWTVLARPQSSRTVGLVQLDSGTMLVGLRRSENGRTSIVRSTDAFASFDWITVNPQEPRQNVTCFGYWGGDDVWAGVGFEGSGKVFHSTDDGRTWRQQADFPAARDLMDFFRHDGRIYVSASGIATLFSTADGGKTWDETRQFWSKGFVGQVVRIEWRGKPLWLMTATDQRKKTVRHVVLISDDPAGEWFEWIELTRDHTGGASNLAQISTRTVVVGTGNHSTQGRAFTLLLSE